MGSCRVLDLTLCKETHITSEDLRTKPIKRDEFILLKQEFI
jgi:hypothetical protein